MAVRLALSLFCKKKEYIHAQISGIEYTKFIQLLSEPRWSGFKDLQDFTISPINREVTI